MNNNLKTFFNLPKENNEDNIKSSLVGGTFDLNNFQKDYELAQSNIKDLIGSGNIALENALKVATESDAPRAFEVVAILLKTMADLNNNMLDVHKKAKMTTSDGKQTIKQTNNAVFIGSTKDLQNLLNKERSTDKEVIDVEILNHGSTG